MSDGLDLPRVDRGALFPEAARVARFDAALAQMRAVLAGESDAVALQSTLACLLWEVFAQTSWCGFYRRVGAAQLAVGPYQGSLGCLRIAFARGVCGAAARTGETQIVPAVAAFPGHIACDGATRSELVIPVRGSDGQVRAVLDLDSHSPAAFGAAEARRLEALLAEVFARPDVEW